MKIAIIGRGNVAKALSKALRRHDIMFGVREPEGPLDVDMAAAAFDAEIVILATPASAATSIAEAIKPHIDGKTVIDTSNPVGMTDHGLDLVSEPGRSAAQTLQDLLPKAHVIKSLNQIGAEFMANPGLLQSKPAMLAAGDDDNARATTLSLIEEAGFEAIDAGPLSNARHLESLAMLWIWSAAKGALGRRFGFAITHKHD